VTKLDFNSKLKFDSGIYVDLVQHSTSDLMVANAARVSTLGSTVAMGESGTVFTGQDKGLINFLMANRHGTPFEHGMFTFRVQVPIFVMRELHRHRVGFSYNEESGRYKVLDAHFYVPSEFRPLVQEGKPGAYEFVTGSKDMFDTTKRIIERASTDAWYEYELLLKAGIAKEVARMVLPVNIYSSCYVTCNPRSLMHFLSLRTKDESATFPSFPMQEIERMADQFETHFAEKMPVTHETFCKNGRVAP
jgi:thymidylate synthase (FAD)